MLSVSTPPPRFSAGQVIDGRYELERPVGSGGMSEVWSGVHLGLGRKVALKFIRNELMGMPDRMRAEARLLSHLRHPSIVEVYDLGRLPDGTSYLTMELLDGVSLAEHARARGGRLPVVEAVALVSRILAGLSVVHAAGIVHRDIKPENVLVTSVDDVATPKLIDFGIALSTLADAPRLTAVGSIVGTPAYLAPEQVLGATADATTDLWATGVVLYELLTGEVPFGGVDMPRLFRSILEQPLAFPRDVPGLDGALFSILSTALRKDSVLRYPSARQMREALDAWLEGKDAVEPVIPISTVRDSLARAPTPLATSTPAEPPRSLDALIRSKLRRA